MSLLPLCLPRRENDKARGMTMENGKASVHDVQVNGHGDYDISIPVHGLDAMKNP
jgi:hypothetical protein